MSSEASNSSVSASFVQLDDANRQTVYTGIFLRHAIQTHQFDLAKKLIAYGADVREKTTLNQTALHLAVTNTSDVEKTGIIPNYFVYLEEKFDKFIDSFNYATTARWEEAISLASDQRKTSDFDSAGRLSLVEMLLTFGADVNSKDHNGCSPIQCAVYTGDLELVQTLIKAGADIENRNRMGVTPLFDSILYCNIDMVRLLLSYGARVNAERIDGETPLLWATLLNRNNSHAVIIRELLKHPVDVNSECFGVTPFHCILAYANLDLTRQFVELKADATIVDVYRRTSLYFAAPNADKDVLNLVLQMSDTEIDQKCNVLGCAPLHIAGGTCRPDNVQLLIEWGADVNAKDDDYWTPLFLCVNDSQSSILRPDFAEDRRKTISLLLEGGSDVNAKAIVYWGQLMFESTVLEEAIRREDLEASKMIVEHVAAIEASTSKPVFGDYNLAVIDKNYELKGYYKKCQAELTLMKNSKIQNTLVTYFTILTTKSTDVLARYARNDDVVIALKNSERINAAYPIYSSRLRAKFDAGVVQCKLCEDVCAVLSTLFQFVDPSNLCCSFISKYLSTADANFLVKSFNEIGN
ncbi:putative ankyrin repeat protein RF_0381 [Nasonia vitripennis]|uniref:Uncharacterized protein n=1 Tax=Nasonia vitripennis TaxID=7425 RepID=A0A7M7PW61_NASVI|nr:putative ankyrin repeat protein RF_0381 [Nasonia vitripennis]